MRFATLVGALLLGLLFAAPAAGAVCGGGNGDAFGVAAGEFGCARFGGLRGACA